MITIEYVNNVSGKVETLYVDANLLQTVLSALLMNGIQIMAIRE